ncbi:MAG: ArsR/SmtB family transcription factor [Luteolibacter sp.]|jgi:DNA-binding transcriptional ArsR family regulator
MKLSFNQLERVAGLFRAFGEPTRLAILQELKSGELSVSAIVERIDSSQANISKQLKVLHEAGLVTRRKQSTQVLYAISGPMVFKVCALVCDKLNHDTRMAAKLKF